MNCPKCFNPLQPNQKFCEVCGTKVGAAEMDVDKTVAADPYDIPEQPQTAQKPQQPLPWQQPEQQPEQQQASPWQQPEQQQPEQQQASPWQQPEQQQSEQQQASPWQQPEQQPEQQQASPWQQPEQQQSEQQQASPWQQPEQQQQSPWQQPEQQQSPWQQPAQQQAYQQPQQPQQPSAWQQPSRYGPAQSRHDFSQQYRQYQQPSQYASSQPEYNNGYGYNTMTTTQKKGFNPKILIIVIAAVLVVAGIVLGIVFGVKGCAANSHQIVSATTGVVLAENEAINTNDSDAESKLNAFLNSENRKSVTEQEINSEMNGAGTTTIFAKGNAVVFEINVNQALDSSQKDAFKQYMDQSITSYGSALSSIRSESKCENAVLVFAVVDSNKENIYSKVFS